MLMRMMMMGNNPLAHLVSNHNEDERALQRAIEESRGSDPNPDTMTYEQLIELGDRVGKVSKGLTKEQIAKIPSKAWRTGKSL